jgi:hypothetical protein
MGFWEGNGIIHVNFLPREQQNTLAELLKPYEVRMLAFVVFISQHGPSVIRPGHTQV